MRTVTINVSEPIYRDFTEFSKQVGRPTSELIRSAMEEYHASKIARQTSLRERRSISVGGAMNPLSSDDDILGEMLDATRD